MMPYDAYKKSVAHQFAFLKGSDSVLDAQLRAIAVGSLGFLIPLGLLHAKDPVYIQHFKQLQDHIIHATPEVALQQFLAANDAILYWVTDIHGAIHGAVGIADCFNELMHFEITYLATYAENQLFASALHTLLEHLRKTLYVEAFIANVAPQQTCGKPFFAAQDFVETENMHMRWQPKREVGKEMILTAGPSISAKEAVYAYDAALYGWNKNWSKYLTQFETAFAEYIGVKYAIATSSCTGALQIALMALEVGDGDEVIVPDLTWVATANAVRYVGATPVFADIDAQSWTLDPASFESLITPKTKAVIPVHLYGHPARMDEIHAIAKKHGLYVLEDAAPAIGAEWKGRRSGTTGDFAAFSFQGAKLLVTGEGGMLVTNDEALYRKAYKIWDQGRNPAVAFLIDGDGVKFKQSNVAAAIGLGQIERADEQIAMKRRIFNWYEEGLAAAPHVALQYEAAGAKSIYWLTNIILDKNAPLSRDQLVQELKARNVDTRPVFPTISQYPIWSRKQAAQPVAADIAVRAINLPSGVCLSKEEVVYVCQQIQAILRK